MLLLLASSPRLPRSNVCRSAADHYTHLRVVAGEQQDGEGGGGQAAGPPRHLLLEEQGHLRAKTGEGQPTSIAVASHSTGATRLSRGSHRGSFPAPFPAGGCPLAVPLSMRTLLPRYHAAAPTSTIRWSARCPLVSALRLPATCEQCGGRAGDVAVKGGVERQTCHAQQLYMILAHNCSPQRRAPPAAPRPRARPAQSGSRGLVGAQGGGGE